MPSALTSTPSNLGAVGNKVSMVTDLPLKTVGLPAVSVEVTVMALAPCPIASICALVRARLQLPDVSTEALKVLPTAPTRTATAVPTSVVPDNTTPPPTLDSARLM